MFKSKYRIIKKSGLFDEKYYLSIYEDVRKADINPIKHYIKNGWKEGRNPSRNFNTNEYINAHKDIKTQKLNPLIHYILNHKKSNSLDIDNTEQMKKNQVGKQYNLKTNSHFSDTLAKINQIIGSISPEKEHELSDYLLNWQSKDIEFENFFSSSMYTEIYPDIKNAKAHPLLHFLNHGRREGRTGYIDLETKIEKGKKDFMHTKETIVFVSHESSATGAPLLGYGIADKLSEKYNIVHIVLRKANIHEIFLNNCDLMLHDIHASARVSSFQFLKQLMQTRSIKCVMINSIVGHQVMHAAYALDIPIVFLIHEFAEYMRPFGTMVDAVLHSEVVITPATIIQDSIQKEFKRFTGYKELPSNMHILPQGKLPYIPDTYGDDDTIDDLYKKLNIDKSENVKIVVGSGGVQIRKGVDLFIATAKYVKKLYHGKCKFVWVGDGFNPDADMAYSVYLAREIEFSGLGDDFTFLEHQKNLDNIFSIADVFCLSSRMDPFPNVAIDALSHDLHIACFDYASGTAEFLRKHHADCSIVDFLDTYELANKITQYLENSKNIIGTNKQISDIYLNFETYVAQLDRFIEKAILQKQEVRRMIEKLSSLREFSKNTKGGTDNTSLLCQRYIENHLKQITIDDRILSFSDELKKNARNEIEIEKKDLCILHIGMPKTGSSAIEEALFNNIVDSHISYTNLPRVNHSPAIYSLFSKDVLNYHFIQMLSLNKDELKVFNKRNRDLLIDGFINNKTNTEIISGEDIFHLQKDEIFELHNFLKVYFKKIIVVGYVRAPKSFMESAFQQYVKYHNASSFNSSLLYHPYKNFKNFDDIFEKENVLLWKFEPKNFPNMNVVEHFTQHLNVNIKNKTSSTGVNESISKEAISILFTYHNFTDEKSNFQELHYELNEKLIETLRPIWKSKFKFSSNFIDRIIKENENDFGWIVDRLNDDLSEDRVVEGIETEEELMQFSINYIDDLVTLLGNTPVPYELLNHPRTVAKLVDTLKLKLAKEMQTKTAPKELFSMRSNP